MNDVEGRYFDEKGTWYEGEEIKYAAVRYIT